MAALFDGDPQPLYDIILDPNADEYLRASMCEVLAMVTLRGELDRDLAGRFLRDAFMEIQPQAECYAWVGWQSAIAMLGLSDLKILVKEAFDRGFIDSHVLGFHDFEQDLKQGIDHPANRCGPMMTSTRFSVILSTSCPDGIASPSNTMRTESGVGNRPTLIQSSASPTRIRSKGLDETAHVPAAV